MTKRTLVNRCLRLRPETDDLATLASDPDRLLLAGVKMALRDLACGRWKALDTEIKSLNQQIAAMVGVAAPELVELFGVGTELAGQFLVTAGDNPDRIRNEAAFAKLCGVAPQPASSGRTTGRHRLSRSGDRQANSALYIVAIVRSDITNPPAPTSNDALTKASASAKSSAASLVEYHLCGWARAWPWLLGRVEGWPRCRATG